MEDFNHLIRQQPHDGRILLGRARCYLRQKLIAQALSDLEAAQQLDPSTPIEEREQQQFAELYLDRSKQALDHRDFVAAVADLQRASKLAPRDARAFSRLGAAWSGQKQWQKAADSLTTALAIAPDDRDYLTRGRANLALDQVDKAIADFSEAVRLNRSSALANSLLVNTLLLRATACLQEGKKNDAAAADLAEVAKLLRPDDRKSVSDLLDTLDALVTAYADDRQFAKAAEWAQKAIDLAPDEPTRSAYHERLKKYQAATRAHP
jgi:tetratricopeptide (TPR) repeat protein